MSFTFRHCVGARLRSADVTASGGLANSPASYWQLMLTSLHGEEQVKDLCTRIATGDLPPSVRDFLLASELIALPRVDGRVRPISMPLFLRKLAMGAFLQTHEDEVKNAVGDRQFGINQRDGTTQAYHTLEAALRQHPDCVLVALDCSAAFPSIDRRVLEPIVRARCPAIANAMAYWFSVPHKQVYRGPDGVEEYEIRTGVGQGDPLAGALFSIGLREAIDRLRNKYRDLAHVAYLDDTYLIVLPSLLPALLHDVQREWAALGLRLNPEKTKLFAAKAET